MLVSIRTDPTSAIYKIQNVDSSATHKLRRRSSGYECKFGFAQCSQDNLPRIQHNFLSRLMCCDKIALVCWALGYFCLVSLHIRNVAIGTARFNFCFKHKHDKYYADFRTKYFVLIQLAAPSLLSCIAKISQLLNSFVTSFLLTEYISINGLPSSHE